MQFGNSDKSWGIVAQGFHWLIAGLILAAWLTFQLHDAAPKGSPERLNWLLLHKSCGITVFFLVWLRLAWRLANKPPLPVVVAPWQDRISRLVHLGLYVVMIGMPVTGIIMTQYEGHPAGWFGLFELPTMVSPDKELGKTFESLHTDVFWLLLLGLAGVHIAAALWHHFVLKDDVLKRMLPWIGK